MVPSLSLLLACRAITCLPLLTVSSFGGRVLARTGGGAELSRSALVSLRSASAKRVLLHSFSPSFASCGRSTSIVTARWQLPSRSRVHLRSAQINEYHAPAPAPLTAAGTAELATVRGAAAANSIARWQVKPPTSRVGLLGCETGGFGRHPSRRCRR